MELAVYVLTATFTRSRLNRCPMATNPIEPTCREVVDGVRGRSSWCRDCNPAVWWADPDVEVLDALSDYIYGDILDFHLMALIHSDVDVGLATQH